MHMEVEGLMNETGTAGELKDTQLTSAETLVRWVLFIGFVAVLLTEAWLLWRAWAEVF